MWHRVKGFWPMRTKLLGLNQPRAAWDELQMTPQRQWHQVVEDYTKKNLSYPEDIFPALQGIAQLMQQRRGGCRYFAGLWEDNLIYDLLWYADGLVSPPDPPFIAERPLEWRAPKWSWASTLGNVGWFSRVGNFEESPSKILNISTTLAEGSGVFGQIDKAELRLSGLCLEAKVVYDGDSNNDRSSSRGYFTPFLIVEQADGVQLEIKDHRFKPDYCFDLEGQYHIASGTRVRVLRMATFRTVGDYQESNVGLAFRCVDESQRLYERIGFVLTHYELGSKMITSYGPVAESINVL